MSQAHEDSPSPEGEPAAPPRDAIRFALAHVLRLGGRELRIAGGVATAVDGMGRAARLETAGRPSPIPVEALRRHSCYRDEDEGKVRWAEEFEDDLLGTWSVKAGADGALTLRAKRPQPACVEALVGADPGELSLLRALYRHPGVDVRIACAGDTRARQLALAICAERRLLGLPTRHEFPPSLRFSYRKPDAPIRDVHDVAASPLPAWSVVEARREERYSLQAGEVEPGTSRVHVTTGELPYYRGEIPKALERATAPTVLVQVEIVGSAPVARIQLSDAARALAQGSPGFADSPWERFAGQREARLKARPPRPRTWHQTTQAVSDAFVAREAPRGFVSGYALYFHGPVLYSLYDGNPIAAFVATPDGKPLILTGRASDGPGGTQAGTITSAQQDLWNSTREGVRRIDVHDLRPIVRLGGIALASVPGLVKRDKSEASLPRDASVDPEALAAWISLTHEARLKELSDAYVTRFPTQRQAGAYRALHLCARRRDGLAEALGLSLPDVGDADAWEALERRAQADADARQADLAHRSRLEDELERAARAAEQAEQARLMEIARARGPRGP